MVILTQDPSFNALAFSVYDGKDTVYIDNCSYSLGSSVGFEKVFRGCEDLWLQYENKLNSLKEKGIVVEKIFSEIPPPTISYSAGLYALDTYMLDKLSNFYGLKNDVYIIPSSYLSTVHGTNKYKKGDSTHLAKYFMEEVLKDDFKFVIPDNKSAGGRVLKGRMNNDRAESFLFMLRAFVKYDIKGYADKIVSEMSGFGYEAERLLREV